MNKTHTTQSQAQLWQNSLHVMESWLERAQIPLSDRTAINCCEDQSTVQEWALTIDNVDLSVTLVQTSTGVVLQVFAPIAELSAVRNHAEQFGSLLQLNASSLSGCAFGLEDDTIMVLTDRSAQPLHHTTIDETISSVTSICKLRTCTAENVPEHLSEVYTLFCQWSDAKTS